MSKKSHLVHHFTAKTWFGVPVKISVSNSNIHRVSVPWFSIPHPGLVNLITRQGLSEKLRLDLTALHELGHFQTLPLILLHFFIIIFSLSEKPTRFRWKWMGIGILTHSVMWEVLAEIYVVVTDQRTLSAARLLPKKLIYYYFWGTMIVFSIVGTFLLTKKQC